MDGQTNWPPADYSGNPPPPLTGKVKILFAKSMEP
jgi:hypothetical protein